MAALLALSFRKRAGAPTCKHASPSEPGAGPGVRGLSLLPVSVHVDTFIIGAGQAGVPLARDLAAAGRRVALAERAHLGGSCVNFGCTPTKAVLASAHLAHLARRAAEFGLRIPTVEPDFRAVMARARGLRDDSRRSLAETFEGEGAPTLLRGHARFTGRDGDRFTLEVEGEGGTTAVTANRVVIDTGTRSRIPEIDGLDAIGGFLDAGNWIHRDERPDRLLMLGGSYVGLELGQFYRRMGAEVTVVHAGRQILDREDEDVAGEIQRCLEEEGVRFHLGCEAVAVEGEPGRVRLTVESADGRRQTLEGTHLFLATGRVPNTRDLGLDRIGLEPKEDGMLEVDRHLRTHVEGVFAVGDVRGGPPFTHTAWDDYRVVASFLTGDGSHTTDRVVPYGVFTDPELGRVGLTERAAREQGTEVAVVCYPMERNGRAREQGEAKGFVKVIADPETRKILGAAALGLNGAELVHVYVTLMNADLPYTVVRDALHVHPTQMEAVQSALKELP